MNVTLEGFCRVQQRGGGSFWLLHTSPLMACIHSQWVHLHNCIFHEVWSMPDPYCKGLCVCECVCQSECVWPTTHYILVSLLCLVLMFLCPYFIYVVTALSLQLSPSGPASSLPWINTLTWISSSPLWFLPCLRLLNISKEGLQLVDGHCGSYQVKWFLISVNGWD